MRCIVITGRFLCLFPKFSSVYVEYYRYHISMYFPASKPLCIFCLLSSLLHIFALSAAGQIRQTEIGFFFTFGFGSAGIVALMRLAR